MEKVILVREIGKSFRTYKKEAGFLSTLKSVFRRDWVKKIALHNINFEVFRGEIFGILGPNGAGKSTLIKILTGILHPDKGFAKVLGYIPWKERKKLSQHIGIVFGQKSQLFWDLPAIDSFELFKEIYGIPADEYKGNLNSMVKLLDAKEIIKRPVRNLSLGERMKCELIVSLLHNPKIVFLDEPTIGLDILAKESIREFIRKIAERRKTTFILTTHDVGDVEELCERCIILDKGLQVYLGGIEDLKKYFGHKKILTIKLEDRIKVPKVKGLKVLKEERYKVRVEVDTKVVKIRTLLQKIFSPNIIDIEIENPDLEEVLKKIYRKGRKWERSGL